MLKTAATLTALAQKMANPNLTRTDTDLFYSALIDHVRAVENILQDKGIKFPDGTVQPSGLKVRADNITKEAGGTRDFVAVDDIVATFLAI